MDRTHQINAQLAELAAYLADRQPAILQTWRDTVANDPQLTSASSLPRKQLNDHIPHVLDALGRELRARAKSEQAEANQETKEDAAAHGLHRWQQGYHLREVAREWRHLQLCVAEELRIYAASHPDLEPDTMPNGYRILAGVCGDGVSNSTDQYFAMQQVEAAGYVRDLEEALEQVRELERQRAELWREAAHDLRGNLGVVANVTAGDLKFTPVANANGFGYASFNFQVQDDGGTAGEHRYKLGAQMVFFDQFRLLIVGV